MKKVTWLTGTLTGLLILGTANMNIAKAGDGHTLFAVTTADNTNLAWKLVDHFVHDINLYVNVGPHSSVEKTGWIILDKNDILTVTGLSGSSSVNCSASFDSNSVAGATVVIYSQVKPDSYACKIILN